MGEYAYVIRGGIRKQVKLGTCEQMYHMTLPQLFKTESSGMLKKCFEELIFRPHVPWEKHIRVGEFEEMIDKKRTYFCTEWSEEDIALFRQHKGTVNIEVPMRNKPWGTGSGLHVQLECAHGFNEVNDRFDAPKPSTFYNGKVDNVFSLSGIKVRNRKVLFEIECGICCEHFTLDLEEFKKVNFRDENYPEIKEYIIDEIRKLQYDELDGEYWRELIDFTEFNESEDC